MITTDLAGELQRQAETDPLTLALNRRSFLNRCRQELERSRRSGLPSSLLLLDLDHFKHFNDTYGHQAGDEALCATVERVRTAVRSIDLVCRWGCEEFAVLLPGASREASRLTAERIRESVSQTASVTISAGAATYQGNSPVFTALSQRADEALYEAKRRGRNQTVLAGEMPEGRLSSVPDGQ